jgi:hypothetical protein
MHPDDEDVDIENRKQEDKRILEQRLQAKRDSTPSSQSSTASASTSATSTSSTPSAASESSTSATSTTYTTEQLQAELESRREQKSDTLAIEKEQKAAAREEQLRAAKWHEIKMDLHERANALRFGTDDTSVDMSQAIAMYEEAAAANNDKSLRALGEIYEVCGGEWNQSLPSDCWVCLLTDCDCRCIQSSLCSLAKEFRSTLRTQLITILFRRRWEMLRLNAAWLSCMTPERV